jgi:hypothetical protein
MLRKFLLGIIAGLALAQPASATIISLSVSSGGIDSQRTCKGTACSGTGTNAVVWTSGALFPATGTVSIDTVALTLTLSLSVVTSSIGGAIDNTITLLTLAGTTYTATVPITISGPLGGVTSYTISAGQTANVDPTLVTEDVGGGSSNPNFLAARVTGQCGLLVDNTGQCGFTFGRVGLQMPAPLSRYLEQTLDMGVVPEPGTLLLLALGLSGLVWTGRRSETDRA